MNLRQLILLIALTATLTACTIEHISNGDLDGFWHLEQVDTLGSATTDTSDDLLFWAFEARLMHTQGSTDSFYLRFAHRGDSLILSEPYLDGGHDDSLLGGDSAVSDATLLAPYGITQLTDTFLVERLNASAMVLRNNTLRLWFSKF